MVQASTKFFSHKVDSRTRWKAQYMLIFRQVLWSAVLLVFLNNCLLLQFYTLTCVSQSLSTYQIFLWIAAVAMVSLWVWLNKQIRGEVAWNSPHLAAQQIQSRIRFMWLMECSFALSPFLMIKNLHLNLWQICIDYSVYILIKF